MAEHHGTMEIGKASGNDYQMHVRTYDGFLRLTKYAVTAIVVVLILMAIFLA
jgi:hypothetical protein